MVGGPGGPTVPHMARILDYSMLYYALQRSPRALEEHFVSRIFDTEKVEQIAIQRRAGRHKAIKSHLSAPPAKTLYYSRERLYYSPYGHFIMTLSCSGGQRAARRPQGKGHRITDPPLLSSGSASDVSAGGASARS